MNKELDDALNVIGKYCSEQMPIGWELKLTFDYLEISVELTDRFEEIQEGWESDNSDPITDACDYAQHMQAELDADVPEEPNIWAAFPELVNPMAINPISGKTTGLCDDCEPF